jgi:hypothetical protein
MLEDGNVDELSLHAALPVLTGEKWICNFWIMDLVRASCILILHAVNYLSNSEREWGVGNRTRMYEYMHIRATFDATILLRVSLS